MRVLIACEFSGRVRSAFAALGHDAWSCDMLPTELPGNHHQGDVLEFLATAPHFDLMIAHPPCTYLARSGARWWKDRADEQEAALEFVRALLNAPVPRIALENPPGCIGTRIRKADQYIQPWEFGEDAKKMTGLWLKNLPLLVPTAILRRSRYANQLESGQDKLGPSPNRWKERSRTYPGVARAMAVQWGAL